MAPRVLHPERELARRHPPSSCASLCQMQQMLRHSRHSRLVPRSLALARAALLSGLALPTTACPAVVELDPEPETEDGAVETDAPPSAVANARPGSGREFDAGAEDGPSQRVMPPPPNFAAVPPAPPCSAPPVPPQADSSTDVAKPGVASAGASGSGALGPDAALRTVLAAGYKLPCGSVPGQVLTALPEGYELSALGPPDPCRPSERTLYRLRVSKSGQITILGGITVDPAQLGCDGGQPEPTLATSPLA